MLGTTINSLAIVVGSLIGLVVGRGLPEQVKAAVMQGLALAVVIIGTNLALGTSHMLLVIIALVLGVGMGTAMDLDGLVVSLGRRLEEKVGKWAGPVGRAFTAASILFCTGAMAIVGAIEDGLLGRPDTLLSKAGLDGVASIIMSATMGVGVVFSAVPVFLYQGAIGLAASRMQFFFTPEVVQEISATGGLVILGIGLDMLGAARVRAANLLPALPLAALLAWALS